MSNKKQIPSVENTADATNSVVDVFTLDSDFSISSIEEIKTQIDVLVSKTNEIIIKGENLKTIDLTGIQLLYSLKKMAVEKKKKISFDITLKEEAETLLSKAGFDITNI